MRGVLLTAGFAGIFAEDYVIDHSDPDYFKNFQNNYSKPIF